VVGQLFYNLYAKEFRMKALLKTLGIIVIATIIGFSMTACGDGSGGGGGGGGGGPIPLTENQWKEGIITEADGYIEYTISFPSTGSYRIWWNDSGDGDGNYLADIKVSAWKSNGEPVFTDVDSAWDSGKQYISTAKGETIRIRVELKDNDIANIGMFAIVFSSSSSKPPFFPSSFTSLTVNQWKDGTVANANDADWYSLSVTSGTTYYFWWNERDYGTIPYGNGTKSGDIYVSAWYSNGNPVALPSTGTYFTNRDGAWGTPITFTATSSSPVYVRVIPFLSSSSNTGTYGIVYSTSNTRPSLSFNVPTPTSLEESVWKDGNLFTSSSVDWYSISVTNGTTYNLWWNERNPNGDNSKVADVKVTVFSNDGTVLLTETNTSWESTIASFNATTTGIVYVRVKPQATGSIGTYGIVYSITSTKPTAPFSVDATPLEELEWEDGNLPTAYSMDWYSISVTQGSTYYIFCNECEFNSTSYGDGTKTGKVYVYVANEEGTFIVTERDRTWQNPASFTATYTGKVYVMVVPFYSIYTGTYGIAYNTTWAIPTIPMNVVDPIQLIESEWKDGNLPASDSINWYSFPVTSGTQYRLWWNERDANGNGTKTANVAVSAWYSNEALTFINIATAWGAARTFTPSSNGTVYVRVIAENSSSSNTGTYAIVYSTANTRPAAPFNVTATLLTESEWKNGSLPIANGVDWYSISVTDGSTYNLWWNDRGGNSTKTGDVKVTIFTNEGTILVPEKDDSWTAATSITPIYTGMVYVKVVPKGSSYIGTYGIVYSTDTTRPPVTLNGTPLIESVWQNGNLPATNSEDWYSISVTSGTTYRLWWNDSGQGNSTKTGDVKVTIFSNEGTVLASEKDSSWTNATSISPTYTGMVFVRVVPYSSTNSNYTGTYGIVYSTSTTRPAVP
jgi:hypothetical protein